MNREMGKVQILNVQLDNYTKEEVLSRYYEGLFINPNVDGIVRNHYNCQFHEAVKKASMVICDSKILGLCSKLLPHPVKEVIPGSSFFSDFYFYHKDNPEIRIFLLGGKEGVAEKAQKLINQKVGRDIVVGTYSPPFGFEKDVDETTRIIRIVDKSNATVVMTGISDPKQTIWLADNKNKFQTAKMFMALGATIDFEAGNVKRAPQIFQQLALEWAYRLYSDPKRLFKRYFVDDIKFFWLFGKQLLGLYKDSFRNSKP